MHWPPGRPLQKEPILKANELISAECAAQKLKFLDIHDDMLEPDGRPNRRLYTDHLHPGPKAYEIWAKKLHPLLTEAKVASPAARPEEKP
jgi:lysophospholipase L1-like esterase